MQQLGAPGGVRFGHDHAGLLVLHVEQDLLPHSGGDGLTRRAQQDTHGDLVGQRPADPGGTFGEGLGRVAAMVFGEEEFHEPPLQPQPLPRLPGRGLRVAAHGLVDQPVEVFVARIDEFVHRGRRDLDALPDLGQPPPGESDAHAVDRLERVEAAAVEALAAAELLEDARRYGRPALGGLQVLDEDLDGTPDADQGHRLARLVQNQGQLGVLAADLPQDLLGERGRLGHGDRRELPYFQARYVVPRRAGGHGRRTGGRRLAGLRWRGRRLRFRRPGGRRARGHGVNSLGPLART